MKLIQQKLHQRTRKVSDDDNYAFSFEKKPRASFSDTESLSIWMATTTILVVILTFIATATNNGIDFIFTHPTKSHDTTISVTGRILVSIVSHNDVSCIPAIDTAIARAYNPERLSFIIVNINTDNPNVNQSCIQPQSAIG